MALPTLEESRTERRGFRERQLTLFGKGWTWQELPRDVRRDVINVLATLCVELVLENPTHEHQESDHESSRD